MRSTRSIYNPFETSGVLNKGLLKSSKNRCIFVLLIFKQSVKPASLFLASIMLLSSGLSGLSGYGQSPDTIKQLPFIETWESGSFDTNGWSFPYMQGNWTILTTAGNPEPCAAFPGYPSNSTYLYMLESPWFDATQLTCDQILLEFELKLESANPTGLEKFRVELLKDSSTISIFSLTNITSFEWDPISIDLTLFNPTLFKLRFYASGQYSPSITGWYLDNIHVTRECKRPKDLENWSASGVCSIYDSTCFILLVWRPPVCNISDLPVDFIFDDGTAENGWAINPGYLAWMGTEFPVDPYYSGVIQHVEVWFGWGLGTPGLTVDIFDGNQTLVGSSTTFYTPSEDWLTIPLPNIPFDGPFYAMVKWDNLSSGTNFFGYDENGPNTSLNLAWYYDGMTWDKMSSFAGTVPGTFMIRAQALLNSDGTNDYSDSTLLLGYNVYFDDIWSDKESGGFVKRNEVPVIDTFYYDVIPCQGDYYVTAVYSDSCESPPSEVSFCYGCWLGTPELQSNPIISIKPNPASDYIEVESSIPFTEIRIIDMVGVIRYTELFNPTLSKKFHLPFLASGSYIVSIQIDSGPVNRKLIISR